jgi:hypothetical protein
MQIDKDTLRAALEDMAHDITNRIDALEAGFRSEQYAVGQPISSAGERFALDACRGAVAETLAAKLGGGE